MNISQISYICAWKIDFLSALFSAIFCLDAVEIVVVLDQRSDVNLLLENIFKTLKSSDPGLKVTESNQPHVPIRIGKTSVKVSFTHQTVIDVPVRIQLGTRVVLRSVPWEIAKVDYDIVMICRNVLQSIGCDKKALLPAAARERHNGFIAVPQAMEEDSAQRISQDLCRIAFMFNFGVSHSHRGEDDDELDESDVYIDKGRDEPSDLDRSMRLLVYRAK
ncbi:unnamed protein product [Agarophyton chilense]